MRREPLRFTADCQQAEETSPESSPKPVRAGTGPVPFSVSTRDGFDAGMFAWRRQAAAGLSIDDVERYGVTAEQLAAITTRCVQRAGAVQEQADRDQGGGLSSDGLRGLLEHARAQGRVGGMTTERMTAAVQLRDAGNSTSAIARQLGVGASSVSRALTQYDHETTRPQPHGA